MPTLHKVEYRRGLFCGPVALAAVTGLSVIHARHTIATSNGKDPLKNVKGVFRHEMQNALNALGVKNMYGELGERVVRVGTKSNHPSPRISTKKCPSLQEFVSQWPDFYGIVNVTGHFVAVHGKNIVDTWRPQGQVLNRHPHKTTRVAAYWAIAEVRD